MGDAGGFGYIGEASAGVLAIETVPIGGIIASEARRKVHRIFEPSAVDQKNVETAILVIVEQRHAAAHRLDQIFLRSRGVAVGEIEAWRTDHFEQPGGGRNEQ